MIRVLLFGSRYWHDEPPVLSVVAGLRSRYGRENLLVIEGKAPGADTLCGRIARENGIHVVEVGALWDSYGPSAGPRRNAVMASLQPHLGVGFHRDIAKSKGTADMRHKLKRVGIPCVIVVDLDAAQCVSERLSHAR